MKKVLLILVFLGTLACSSDDKEVSCPNGKIKAHTTIQDRNFITLDNGKEIDIAAKDFDKYPTNTCYEGVK